MKWILRTFIILVAAMIVVGGTFALSRSSVADSMTSNSRGRHAEHGERPEGLSSERDDNDFNPEGDDRFESDKQGGDDHNRSGFSWMSTIKNLTIIGIITFIILFFQWAWSRSRKNRRSDLTEH